MSTYPYDICSVLKEASDKLPHLKELLQDKSRTQSLQFENSNLILDLTHERLDGKTLDHFETLCEQSNIFEKIQAMFTGVKINSTENRAVLHTALRANKTKNVSVDGKNVIPEVHEVLDKIKIYSEKIRSGEAKGATGKNLKNLVIIGIGGSYLGIEFVYEALKYQYPQERNLRFLANVDPIDFAKATEGLNPEETLFLINSKTFTTSETMLNARTSKSWLIKGMKDISEKDIISKHMCACSTNLKETSAFGVQEVFGFWDWVGGRYSVCSSIGMLPLSIHFGFDVMEQFLRGAENMDECFVKKNLKENIPLLVGLLDFYHITVQDYNARAILPYCQALSKLAPHIQQVEMESNGKRVDINGKVLNYKTAGVIFGEPGTNGQHSFYQLLHQGTEIPCEFIGFCKSQNPIHDAKEIVSNHDELMSNFFSQPDALACGKTSDDLHREFPGNRPSFSLLFEKLDAYSCGQLLALYEHRTATEGFLWNINSFDQFGVELGKVLAANVRKLLAENNESNVDKYGFNSATSSLVQKYMKKK